MLKKLLRFFRSVFTYIIIELVDLFISALLLLLTVVLFSSGLNPILCGIILIIAVIVLMFFRIKIKSKKD